MYILSLDYKIYLRLYPKIMGTISKRMNKCTSKYLQASKYYEIVHCSLYQNYILYKKRHDAKQQKLARIVAE